MFSFKSGWYHDPEAHDKRGFILENLQSGGIAGMWFTYTAGNGSDRVPTWMIIQPKQGNLCDLYITDPWNSSKLVGSLLVEPLGDGKLNVSWKVDRGVFYPPHINLPSPMPPAVIEGSSVVAETMVRVG